MVMCALEEEEEEEEGEVVVGRKGERTLGPLK